MRFIVYLIILFYQLPMIAQNVITKGDPINKDSVALQFNKQQQEIQAKIQKASLMHFVIKADSNTYGYMIFVDGQMYIEQKSIPGHAGILGFATAAHAEKCANLVISKIKEGEIPPTINDEELKKLGVN